MKALFEYYLKNIQHKGKRHTTRWALKALPFCSLRSHYGPIMRVKRNDKTNIYALSGEYGHVVSNHINGLVAGEVFIDIGTNYGLFSLMASERVGPSGSVFSFEPNPMIYSQFLDNIRLNKCQNIIPFHCAVSHTEGLLGLTYEEGHSGKSHLSTQGNLLVPAFDPTHWQFLTEKIGQRPIHIKIDVEGYEAEIIKTLITAPWFSNVKSIVVEIDDKNLKSFGANGREDIFMPLESVGFRSTINAQGGIHYDEIFKR